MKIPSGSFNYKKKKQGMDVVQKCAVPADLYVRINKKTE
jgi:hypothetical protein